MTALCSAMFSSALPSAPACTLIRYVKVTIPTSLLFSMSVFHPKPPRLLTTQSGHQDDMTDVQLGVRLHIVPCTRSGE